jgi:HAMP domain-containing protein
MSIRQNLVVLIVITATLLLSIGVIGTSQFRRNGELIQTLTDNAIPGALIAADLAADLKQAELDLIELVSAPSPEIAANAQVRLRAQQARLSESLAALRKLPSTAKESGLIEHATQRLVDYQSATDEVVAHARAGQHVLAEASLYANVAGYKDELQQVLGDLRIEKGRSKDASVDTVREELAHTIRVLGWAGGATLLILIALVIRLHRNIVRPLRAMEGTMAGIAASLDFTQRVPVARNDEIGQSVRVQFSARYPAAQPGRHRRHHPQQRERYGRDASVGAGGGGHRLGGQRFVQAHPSGRALDPAAHPRYRPGVTPSRADHRGVEPGGHLAQCGDP